MEVGKRELGIYIHIPFCKQKCSYCDFVSFSDCDDMQDRYIDCLKQELIQEVKEVQNTHNITTVYIGGGTPSHIDSKYIKEILSLVSRRIEYAEITIEVNPGAVTGEKLLQYREAGVNRLSIGLQSTNNNLLKEIGRIHTYEQFIETYSLARRIGFKNINVDLMIGLPDQKIDDIKESLEELIQLEPEHISVYSLILEEDTPLYKMVKSGILTLPKEDTERQMYWYVKNTLELNGYKHYEISNFAIPDLESMHNVNCWKQKEYIGVGLAASSYLNGIRFSNIRDLNTYIENIEAEEYNKNRIVEEIQSDTDKQKEFMLLKLRFIDGVSIQEFENKFGQNPIYLFRESLNKLVKAKLLIVDGDRIKLTNKGLDLANQVWMEFA